MTDKKIRANFQTMSELIFPARRSRNQREKEILIAEAQRGRAATKSRHISRKDAKAARSEITGKNYSYEFSFFASELGDFSPWREEFPTPSAFNSQIICAGRASFEL